MATKINFIDIYSLYDEIDAGVIESLLDGCNIACMVRRSGPMAVDIEYGGGPEQRIAVEEEKSENARRVIAEAIRSGIISRKGKFWI